MTPYARLRSLPNAERYVKPGNSPFRHGREPGSDSSIIPQEIPIVNATYQTVPREVEAGEVRDVDTRSNRRSRTRRGTSFGSFALPGSIAPLQLRW